MFSCFIAFVRFCGYLNFEFLGYFVHMCVFIIYLCLFGIALWFQRQLIKSHNIWKTVASIVGDGLICFLVFVPNSILRLVLVSVHTGITNTLWTELLYKIKRIKLFKNAYKKWQNYKFNHHQ